VYSVEAHKREKEKKPSEMQFSHGYEEHVFLNVADYKESHPTRYFPSFQMLIAITHADSLAKFESTSHGRHKAQGRHPVKKVKKTLCTPMYAVCKTSINLLKTELLLCGI
jgi:hypothetical protein